MALIKHQVRAEPNGPKNSQSQGSESHIAPRHDVRLIVENKFTLMERAHDRIRAEALAARLRTPRFN